MSALEPTSDIDLVPERPIEIMELALRTYFSIQHLMSAKHFVHMTEVEENRISTSTDPMTTTHLVKTYATAAIFASGAFLEALVNELFADAELAIGGHLGSLPEQAREAIAAGLRPNQMKPMLTKSEQLLQLGGATPIDRADSLAEAVRALIEVRNHLIHYKGPWLDIATARLKRPGSLADSPLAVTLRSAFEPRKGAGEIESARWLGAGCARWSVNSALTFANELCRRLDIQPPYGHVQP